MQRRIVVDFDETITVSDTIRDLVECGIVLNKGLSPEITYEKIIADYKTIHGTALVDDDPHLNDKLHTSDVTLKYVEEYTYQSRLKRYESLSIRNIEKLSVFQGVDVKSFVQEMEKRVTIRSGFGDFYEKIDPQEMYVLSLNFSREVINHYVCGLSRDRILCDGLTTQGGDTYTGVFEGKILTGSDKCDELFEMCNGSGSLKDEVWYIGDSRSDYLSVLHPLVNKSFIIIDRQSRGKLAKCCEFFDIPCEYGEITTLLVSKQWLPPHTTRKRVFVVSSWIEIMEKL